MAYTTTAKVILTVVKSKSFKKIVIIILGGLLLVLSIFSMMIYQSSQCGSSALADQALSEYQYWHNETHNASFSCQGEKYCSHFNTSVTDWCSYFVGYCADTVNIDLDEIKWSAACTPWIRNLKSIDKYRSADTYTPQRGNVIFFDYNGRTHHNATGYADHVGIVVEILDNNMITVICGNESGGENWPSTSRLNKYNVSLSDNTIACYASIGTDISVLPTTLNQGVREIICRNETGTLYSEATSQFGTVVENDNGALSIGVFGWHGNNALSLLKNAYQKNTTQVNQILSSYGSAGSYVYNSIQRDSDWSTYIPDSSVSNCIHAVLLSDAGKASQDDMSLSYAQSYIDKCQENGIRDNKCIMYLSDILNQWGINSFDGGVLDGIDGSWSLERIYNSGAGFGSGGVYSSRRNWTYNYIKSL